MRSYIFCQKTIFLATFFLSISVMGRAEAEEEQVLFDLDEETLFFFQGASSGNSLNTASLASNVLGPLYGSGLGTGYGMGGYGDTAFSGNLTACTSRTVDYDKCKENPGVGQEEWRYVKDLGWRKFQPYGAARKDWWDFKKTIGWPFRQDPRYFY